MYRTKICTFAFAFLSFVSISKEPSNNQCGAFKMSFYIIKIQKNIKASLDFLQFENVHIYIYILT